MREYYTITDGTKHSEDHLVVQLLHLGQTRSIRCLFRYSCQNVKKKSCQDATG
jgi:hypothetical protein